MSNEQEDYATRAQRLVDELAAENGLDEMMQLLTRQPVENQSRTPDAKTLPDQAVRGNRLKVLASKAMEVILTGYALTVPGYVQLSETKQHTP